MTTDITLRAGAELDLATLTPTQRWDVEEWGQSLSKKAKAINDEEIRQWVEVDGKTQTEIAELVGRSQSQIQRRCDRLGLQPTSNRGRPRITPTGNSDPDDEPEELVEGEIVADGWPSVRQQQIAGAAKRRIDTLVGTCQAIAGATDELRAEEAVRVSTEEEVKAWDRSIREAQAALRRLRSRLEEATT